MKTGPSLHLHPLSRHGRGLGITSLRVLLGLQPLTTTAYPLRVYLAAVVTLPSRMAITNHLATVFWLLSGMASSSISSFTRGLLHSPLPLWEREYAGTRCKGEGICGDKVQGARGKVQEERGKGNQGQGARGKYPKLPRPTGLFKVTICDLKFDVAICDIKVANSSAWQCGRILRPPT
jgi:hypothetical protein